MAEDSAACRILVVSSSLQQVFHFVDRVKSEVPTAITSSSEQPRADKTIPWTITNKYYTANVHFEAREIRLWSSVLADGVPAVIFLWAHGEPYKDHIQYLSKELESHDPEVSLAVRIQGSSATSPDEDEDVDEFLSSHGFEFVDARSPAGNCITTSGLSDGVPGLPRVIDALSTIMWPSMVQSHGTRARKSKTQELLDWVRQEERDNDPLTQIDDHNRTPISSTSTDTFVSSDETRRMKREMKELERWLDDGEALHSSVEPWINLSPTDDTRHLLIDPLGMTISPMGMEPPHTVPWTGMELVSETTQQSGFDDDFAVFVSAPAPSTSIAVAAGPSGRSTPNTSFDSDTLYPMYTGASYTSLGSASDFGDEDDLDLPSQAEVQATSTRIFGPTLSPTSSPVHPSKPTHKPLGRPGPSLSQPATTSFSSLSESDTHKLEDEEDHEFGNFDLSSVLSALQNIKEEISGMENEDDRRRAAAKAALGLVYGLEKHAATDDDDERGPK